MPGQNARTSSRRLYVSVLSPILVVACLVAALAAVSVKVLGSVRGYATGESAWSKSCDDAILHLSHYALSRDEADFSRFEQSLTAPLGSRRAREELAKPHPDKALIRQLFIAGGSHPDDVEGMVVLFRTFSALPVFERTISAWVEGDQLIDRLRTVGTHLKRQVRQAESDQALGTTVQQLRLLSDEFRAAETRFRVTLDDAGRFTEWILIGAITFAAAILTSVCAAMIRHSLHKQIRHQRALAAATKRWELAAEVAGLGLFEQNSATDSVVLDAKAAQLYGVSDRACLTPRRRIDRLICEEDRLQTLTTWDHAMQTGQTIRTVHGIHLPNGSTRQLELIGRQDISDTRGETRMVGVVRDVTEERAQTQLAMQRDAAEQVAQAQREFLSRLSHELRTPLNAILGFAQLLELDRNPVLAPHQRKQVEMILTAGHQLLALIEDVLDLTKVEAGEISLSMEPVNLTRAMHASMAMVDSARQLLGVSFVDDLPRTPIWVHADPQRLQQVFMNLLSNSCKYNRPGGRIVISAQIHYHHIVVNISDDGLGMSTEETSQLFQPFKRLPSTAGQMEGTGLGLYIVKQLVEHMNGKVEVQSEKGRGSTFSITLLTPPPPATEPMPLDTLASSQALV